MRVIDWLVLSVGAAIVYALWQRFKPRMSTDLLTKSVPVLPGLLGAFGGTIAGFYVGLLTCLLPQAGNQCGLVGVFITAPIGAVAGAILVIGWYERRANLKKRGSV
jgi:hypothetical protein